MAHTFPTRSQLIGYIKLNVPARGIDETTKKTDSRKVDEELGVSVSDGFSFHVPHKNVKVNAR
jgi:hypothetical protein